MSTFYLVNAITYVIIISNVILKQLTILLMIWVGYDNHSQLQTVITNGVFLVLFANTGMLLTTANANFSEMSPALGKYFNGEFYDYSPAWYGNIGEILT